VQTKGSDDERSVRIAIRSDRRLFHDTLAVCLGLWPDFGIVGHVTSGQDLLDLCRLRQPEIVVFDAGADIAASAGVLAELRSGHSAIHLIITYEHLTRAGIAIAARLGIDALVPHSHGLHALQALLHRHAEVLRSREPEPTTTERGLTEQERQIIAALSTGHTADQVAELLQISRCAVENAKRRIYQKMRVSNQSHAIARAAALGLVDRKAMSRPRQIEAGATLRVAVYARDTLIRNRLAMTLLDFHIPFMISSDAQPSHGPDESTVAWNGRQFDPVVAVLADPEPDQWEAVDDIDVPVLLVRSTPMSRADTMAALSRGVVGMIDAAALEQNLVPALTLAASGHVTVSSPMADGLVAGVRARTGESDNALPELTQRERDILNSIAAGDTVRQTARTLGIAQKTVENIQARLFRKLGVRNRAGAVASAHSLGLLGADGDGEPNADLHPAER
jgi:two-component system, NarL family, nitrate/nitrite response regulator NarL